MIYMAPFSISLEHSVTVGDFQARARVVDQERRSLGPLQRRALSRQSTRLNAPGRPHGRCGMRSRYARRAPASRRAALCISLLTAGRALGTPLFTSWTRFLLKKILSLERRAHVCLNWCPLFFSALFSTLFLHPITQLIL